MYEEDYQSPETTPAPHHSVDVRNLLYNLLENFWLIAICLAAGVGLSLLYLQRTPPIYAATAVLKFEVEQPKILNIEGVVQEDYRREDVLSEKLREIELLLKSRALLAQVVATNRLAANPRFGPDTPTGRRDESRLVGRLSSMIRLDLQKGAPLLNVTIEHPDPQLTAQLANSLVQELVSVNSASYKTASQLATTFLAEEAQQLQRQLNEAETKLQSYKDQSLSLEQRQAVVAENLKDLNQKLNEAKAERVRQETDYHPVQEAANDTQKLLNVPVIASDSTVVALRASIAQAEVEFADIKEVYLPKHPTYNQAQSKLDKLQQVLSNATLKAATVMRATFQNAIAREQALSAELQKQEETALVLNKQFIPYNVLLRDVEQYRSLYDAVVKRMGETSITGKLDNRRVQIIQMAEVPKTPIKPMRAMVLVLGIIGGLGTGLLWALGRAWFDDSFKTMEEAEQFLRIPVLSTIPQIPAVRTSQKQIVMNDETPASGAESFRSLRTSLSLLGKDTKPTSFLFTSAVPGEGKTFCAVNCAVSFAQLGLRTVLIDCDLRRPMVETFLLVARTNTAGVANFLRGRPFQNVLRETTIPNLSIISAGDTSPNPAELFTLDRLGNLLEQAGRHFDRVVIDSAPVFGVSDTLLLARHVQAVCLIVRARATPRLTAQRAVEVLRSKAHAPVVGLILNALPRSLRTAYANPYHDYGYYAQNTLKASPVPTAPTAKSVSTAKSAPSEPSTVART